MIYLKTYENYIGSGDNASYDNSNGEPFWGNIAAGVLPYSMVTKRFLLNYRSSNVNEPHTYGIWGGKLDEETQSELNIIEVAKREFVEETQFRGEIKLKPLYIYTTQNQSFKYYNYLGIVTGEFIPELDWESDGYKWLTLNELLQLEPKHFGLKALLDNDIEKIKQNI